MRERVPNCRDWHGPGTMQAAVAAAPVSCRRWREKEGEDVASGLERDSGGDDEGVRCDMPSIRTISCIHLHLPLPLHHTRGN
jgi:hypothetical protein